MGANSKLYELVLFYDGFTVRVLLFLTRSLRNDQFSLNEVVVSLKLFAVSLSYCKFRSVTCKFRSKAIILL
jgi:hypothetical protein